jgi:hypothetical protein
VAIKRKRFVSEAQGVFTKEIIVVQGVNARAEEHLVPRHRLSLE